ncbi:MAG TPA: thioredoxin-dependent thiol peroxidase [Polyangiaceae bacterium LLY-WYZ-15_(1-7)]|nr:thioredoxin-dependent thiol peroxidase [Sandaracinus sp.]HJK93779.1 thioredoxin-dependent thiol peroxidase [Polyangiaceae bacterium LLY-WYZ-15_(1-7)]MBJ72956.1 thioredoxin-dependent thiol peroxidase [Sandaracinus sp.]HJL06276.1 thioredoxin-dependent thiol peroxidase [Polyangiaceae bacterium LLY-WYZ-15_(1-7)]HJL10829.1 thioredoxin-dependent thiol peroxidase [Polyangiaceae bacterium LLY-WYZ-15_(1-7)]|tara:strand:- start:99 stop:572 length:474 start_codon:yes stop_codon:yes gene_type:complete
MPIEVGKRAPMFTLPADSGEKVALKDLKGKYVVVYFYPKDNTPGCTTEAQGFRDAAKELKKLDAVVLGISKDSIESHCKFRDKHDLNFPLLSDPEGKVLEKYGAWGEKKMYGKTFMGIIRSTAVIGPNGKVVAHFPKVRVKGHVEKVLEAIREHREG